MPPKPSIDTVIFDLGNVLLDWDPRHLYRKIFSCADEMEWFLANVLTTPFVRELDRGEAFSAVVAKLSALFPDYAREISAFDARWPETLNGEIAGSVRLLEQMHAKDTPLYALSNLSGEKYEGIRRRFPFMQRFRGVLVSGEEKLIKPDPAIYRLFLERYGLDARGCLFIDDSAANVEGAREAGLEAVRFENPGQLEGALCAHGIL